MTAISLRTAITVAEAAGLLGIEPRTVRAQLASGALEGTKYGRDWITTAAACERYRESRLGQPGRKASTAKKGAAS